MCDYSVLSLLNIALLRLLFDAMQYNCSECNHLIVNAYIKWIVGVVINTKMIYYKNIVILQPIFIFISQAMVALCSFFLFLLFFYLAVALIKLMTIFCWMQMYHNLFIFFLILLLFWTRFLLYVCISDCFALIFVCVFVLLIFVPNNNCGGFTIR